ncbi:hypothetical protein F0L68_09035 [Solihabitans fulvus]|uniref:Uncharacterized protein n=1 Tax=Solihabitans fulvus TaxID=1892852 RepID=A0A5B2XIX2_9PSEU|nr:hypothetical protein [Solihabitans fulvus]KAA2263808.1 hypothetical protein F0L68_09035 [Solihabitans fulvus]
MPALESWNLSSPPDTPTAVAADLVELREPLVRVARAEDGSWSFDGPGAARDLTESLTLGEVVHAWPHVAVLDEIEPGQMAVWDWIDNGWQIGPSEEGDVLAEVSVDLDPSVFPDGLVAEEPAVVERAVVTGEVLLTDVQRDDEGFSFVGPSQDELAPDAFVLIRLADAVRRWPHAFGVVQALEPGEGMEWDPEQLQWEAYRLSYSGDPEI